MIAIVAIVAAILFPVFGSAKRAAKADVCLSNVAQVSRGLALYLADADDAYPLAFDGPDRLLYLWRPDEATRLKVQALPSETTLRSLLGPYLKSKEVWRCPEDRGGRMAYNDAEGQPGPPLPTSAYAYRGTSYAYRTELGARGLRGTSLCRNPSGTEVGPSGFIILSDASPLWHAPSVDDDRLKGTNVAYGDGHVKRVSGIGAESFLAGWLLDCGEPQ